VSACSRVFPCRPESLPDDVGTFLARHRDVRVTLEERISSEIIRGVRDGVVDFGVCWDAGELGGLATQPYRSDHLCVVCRSTHPLARKKRIVFADTLPYERIEIQPGSMVQRTLRRAAAIANKTLHHRIEVSTFDAACRNVAAGLGIAVVPREVAGSYVHAGELRLVPLSDPWAERRFVICMRSRDTLSATARLLTDYLQARAAEQAARVKAKV
jgi:DNA-binding transcriptional LysR family regulator